MRRNNLSTQPTIKPNFTPLALDILKDRYLHRDCNGITIETPEEMLHRVAHCIAQAEAPENREKYEQDFYEIMARLDFLPNSPTLMNAGRPAPHGQLAACFVIGIEDSMTSICEALRKQMLIHKTGGGTGFNFSHLRPKNSTVNSTNGRASGPVSFMRLFDLSTEVIQQGGMRRGANMAILNADHPDIEEFISCKDDEGVITNFNLSVGLTDEFMVKAIDHPFSREAHVLEEIAAHAWKTGDPGVVFLDALNKDNPCPDLGTIEATNPCGESPLLANEACNLGSINLAHFVKNGWIDEERLRHTVRTATRFLDDVIDVSQYPLPEIEQAVKRTRKIGLGIMGWADMLYQLHIPYDSGKALVLAKEIISFIHNVSHIQSIFLANDKGHPDDVKYRRNATCTCIAPTGTLALLADCSSGIEPIFANYHTRKITLGDGTVVEKEVFNKYYEALVDDPNISDTAIEQICKTAYQIHWKWHIRHQTAFQLYTDLAVSKTVNLPTDATVEDILDCYIMAWKDGLKGTTIYRNGSKSSQVLVESALPPVKCTTC
jgi:ribonucleoside-diphosphate reductase alpha chain